MHLSRPPTQFEFAVVLYVIAAALIGLGVVSLFAASGSIAEKAAAFQQAGIMFLALGVALAGSVWIFRRLTD